MASWKVGPALAAGNSVVLKPAEQSPLSALRLGRARRRGGDPRWRAPGRAGLRRDGRPGDRPAHRRRHGRVHRLDRGRQALPPLLGRVEHEARRARVRRQVAAHRDAGLRRPGRGREGGRVGRSSTTRARSATPGRASSSTRPSRTSCSRGSSPSPRGSSRATRSTRDQMGAIVDERSWTGCSATSSRARARAPSSISAAAGCARTGRLLCRADDLRRGLERHAIAREEIFGPVLSTISFDRRATKRSGSRTTRSTVSPAADVDERRRRGRIARRGRSGRASSG